MRSLRPSVLCASLLLAFVAAACSSPQAGPAPLNPVEPVPLASPPPLIASVSPAGVAEIGSQIRIRFAGDLVPLSALEDPARSEVLSHFQIDPKIPGRFVLWTPRMVGFVSEAPIPPATRIRVTVTGGLKNLKGEALASDYAWSFTMLHLAFAFRLPDVNAKTEDVPAGVLQPALPVTATTSVKVASLADHTFFRPDTHGAARSDLAEVGATVSAPSPGPTARSGDSGSQADPTAVYTVSPVQPLAKGARYRLVVEPGVEPLTGNLASDTGAEGALRTYGELAFSGVSLSARDRFQAGNPQLTFTNRLDSTFDPKLLSLSPAPQPVAQLARADDAVISINPYALLPRTTYTVTVAPGVKDAFGQVTTKTVTATFTTSDLASALWAPSGFRIFPAGAGVRLNVETTNLPANAYRAQFARIDPVALIAHSPTDDALLGSPANWPRRDAPAQHNSVGVTPISLEQKLSGATGLLAYGVHPATFRSDDETATLGAVQITNIGLSVSQFPGQIVVRSQQLRDGSPLANAQVDVYPSLLESAQSRPPGAPALATPDRCATGITDSNGTFEAGGTAFARCAASNVQTYGSPPLYVVVHSGSDWSFARTTPYGDYFEGVSSGWSAGVPVSHGAIVPDRDLFQPGETAHFVAVAFFDENGTLGKAKATSFSVTLADPSGVKRSLGRQAPDAFGTFSFDAAFPKNAPLGFYTISAKAANGEQLDGSVRVAQFKPPNFSVKLSLAREVAVADESVSAEATSTYLFGSPVDGGTQHWFVTRSPASFSPKGWDRFTFGRQWVYPEEQPDVSSDVLSKDVALTATATSAIDVPVDKDIPYPLTYRVEAQTTDASNLAVSDVRSFVALPSRAMVGVNAPYVTTAGQPFDVQTVVVDPLGKAVGQHVTLTLQQRIHDDATQIVEGGERPASGVHYVSVASVEKLSDTKPVVVSLTAPKPGEYRLRANLSDEKNENAATDTYIWVTGAGEFDWGAPDPNRVAVKLDKASYRVGDTANVLVASPFSQAQAYVAVIRHGVMQRQIQNVSGAAPVFHFQVTPEMLPNAAVQVVLVRRGAAVTAHSPATIGKLARIGLAGFNVVLDDKYLRVTAKPRDARVLPGGAQQIGLALTDSKGRPAAGQFAVAVVNESVLQLTGYRFPDLVQTVYAPMPISLRFADNRSDVTLATERNTQAKGFGYGGGMMAGLGSTRVRTDFRPLAYFNAAVKAGADGHATVSFTVPDDLTTWRVLVMALTSDARFGNSETTFIASKPLVTNPLLPQFARLGDRFDAGVSVTDTLGKKGDVAIEGTVGPGLSFAQTGGTDQKTTLQAPIDQLTQAFRFPVVVTGTGEPTFEFRSGLGSASDAFRVTLPVQTSDVTESVVTTGATQNTSVIPLSVDANVPKNYGGLDMTLASTLLPELSVPITATLKGKEPFLLSVASRVSVAASSVQLDRVMRRTAAHAATLDASVRTLAQYFLPDNGFAAWPGAEKSELYTTAFAAATLVNARDAGAKVEPEIARVRLYLEKELADPSASCGKHDDVCKAQARLEALETLVSFGDVRDDHLSDIDKLHESFSYYEQVELARLMVRLPAWHDRGIALRDKLLERVYETGRFATLNMPGSWIETPVAGQSQILSLLIETKLPIESIDKAVSALLAMRTNGTWGCDCDNAEALDALSAYARLLPQPPSFNATATVGSKTLAAAFKGYDVTSVVRSIPIADLPAGRSDITLTKTGDGTLHYVAAYRYALNGDQPGRYQGIRVDRFVRPAGGAAPVLSFGLAKPASPPSLGAGKVFEIEDRIVVDHPVDRVLMTDPMPAGMEAIDAAFRTSTQFYAARGDSWEIDYQSTFRDHVLAFAGHLEAGVYSVHYLVRTVTPGTFSWPGAESHLELAPEEFGRTASSTVTISTK